MQVDAALCDAVCIASQTGRLDLVSAILAVVALVIALGTLPLFLFLKHRAQSVAREEVQLLSKNLLLEIEREAISKIEEMLPTLVEQYRELAKGFVDSEKADQIADAQNGGNR